MSDSSGDAVERVGFRDIYRAVGESESRIKEHISFALLPLTTTLADHEVRLRSIETQGSDEARAALTAATALDARVTVVEDNIAAGVTAGIERRRLGGLGVKVIVFGQVLLSITLTLVSILAAGHH